MLESSSLSVTVVEEEDEDEDDLERDSEEVEKGNMETVSEIAAPAARYRTPSVIGVEAVPGGTRPLRMCILHLHAACL